MLEAMGKGRVCARIWSLSRVVDGMEGSGVGVEWIEDSWISGSERCGGGVCKNVFAIRSVVFCRLQSFVMSVLYLLVFSINGCVFQPPS